MSDFERIGSILGRMIRKGTLGKSLHGQQLDIFHIPGHHEPSAERFEQWMKEEEERMNKIPLDNHNKLW